MLANSKHMSLNIKRFIIRTRAVDNYQFNSILPTVTELTSDCFSDFQTSLWHWARALLLVCCSSPLPLHRFIHVCPKKSAQSPSWAAQSFRAKWDWKRRQVAPRWLWMSPAAEELLQIPVVHSCPWSPHPAQTGAAGTRAELLGWCRWGQDGGTRSCAHNLPASANCSFLSQFGQGS